MADTDLCKAMDEAFPPEPGAGVDLPTLESTAKAATPGPWNNSGSSVDDFDADCMMRMEWIPNGRADDDDELNANYKADAAFIAAWNPTTALSILSRLQAAETEVERLNAACREQFEAATHNAKACNELTAKVEQQKRRADNHWESLRSIREFAREGDCERIILWVNDSGSGYVETAEQTLGVWIDKATTAEALVAQLTHDAEESAGFLHQMREQLTAEQNAVTAQAETIWTLKGTLEHAEDRLHEINVSNYDHDDICKLNDRSVEVILAIRHTLQDLSQALPNTGEQSQ